MKMTALILTAPDRRHCSGNTWQRLLLSGTLLQAAFAVCAAPPIIDFEPANQTVILCQQATFGVSARSSLPIFYQWRKDAVPMVGATNEQIVLAQVQFADAGRYSVIISNVEGSTSSAEGILTVTPPLAGDVDCSFMRGISPLGSSPSVQAITVQADGRLMIGGRISTFPSNVARLDQNGIPDPTFLNGLSGIESPHWTDSPVTSLAIQSDGKVLVGGIFRSVNGVNRTNLARLNADGSLDGGFAFSLDIPGYFNRILTLACQSDGKILVSAEYRIGPGGATSIFTRLNADGTEDSTFSRWTFHYGSLQHPFEGVLCVAVQSDGKLLVAGVLYGFGNIVRLNSNGTLAPGFQTDIGDSYPEVNSILLQPDGGILIAGSFATVNGANRQNLARLHSDGTLDESFFPTVQGGVSALGLDSRRRVLIGGSFTTVDGVSRTNLARLNPDGTLDQTFLNDRAGAEFEVRSIAFDSTGNILIGGEFSAVNGIPVSGIARLWASADIPPRMRSVARSGVESSLSWDAIPGRSYRAQYRENLSTESWSDLAGDVSGSAIGTATKRDTNAGSASQRFYRVLLLP